jgi:hypothetical protein
MPSVVSRLKVNTIGPRFLGWDRTASGLSESRKIKRTFPARTRVELPLDHAAALRRLKDCLFHVVGDVPTVGPFGHITARYDAWLWESEVEVDVYLRPARSSGTEAIVSAELIGGFLESGERRKLGGAFFEWRGPARLVKKVSAALAAPAAPPASIWDLPGVRADAPGPPTEDR